MNEQTQWQAVLDRDARQDGAFVYAVKTTGVYCRPSCASRQPRRENVLFYSSPAEAAAAAYRACKRCRPDQPTQTAPEFVAQARALLDAEGGLPLSELGARLGVSPFHLQRAFSKTVGLSPAQYARAARMKKVKTELRGGATVTDAVYAAGYGAPSRLYETAGRLGMTPAAYGKGGRGERIAHAVAPSALGLVLVAATAAGICAVSFGESEDGLVAGLRSEFPAAEIAVAAEPAEREGLLACARAIAAHIAGAPTDLARFPIDLHGTVFQTQVWRALRDIPRGQTRTYAQVAVAIGRPGAARAVAQACGANHAAVIVPCHRVVAAGGALGGYKWGAARKQRILANESARIATS
ncbi:MAG TPA: methylated-DNA--[protein]-cysteine S-methyltransferase [Thermoflexales bacterium]|nr:methylated-DNA--[protein]-cysteine S-methyltransferase [Thermoflexales bacterium]HQX10590.1 methylated-DNA--[protein]-cysteine S-methyltransferase [Thermoflexales bacterium]HQZ53125.1 methylated-DNA--[protein]-cysteine S-methyltransferase [Thermoflexales bacterium]HRA54550.1 methylated-DNA--[protein]-cysteine S-methyltransferase [Thermoflexales bacterium]